MQAKSKKWLKFLLALIMALTFVPMTTLAAELPEGPTVNGDVWTVTPQNAQLTLDGAYGSIDGKTIHFSAGTYSDVLELARPTKYSGSNTKYYNMYWNGRAWIKEDQPVSYENFIQNSSAIVTYEREINGVTFTADAGAILTGFRSSSGHVYGSAYDYVRDVNIVNNNNSYYGVCSLKNITFSGLTVKDNVVISNYVQNGEAQNTGIKFINCTFQGDANKMTTNGYAAIGLKADSRTFDNIEVSGCKFSNYFQGVYAQGSNNIQVKNNVFTNTTHNAIAIQSSVANRVSGEVVIEENIIKGAGDRAIRFGDATRAERITVENNVMIDSGDGAGELIKGTFPDSDVVSLEHNYWDGKTVETAVANAEVRPAATGIVKGTFPENVNPYRADGYIGIDNGDGTFTVESAKDEVILVNGDGEGKTETVKVEAGQTITLPVPVWSGHIFDGWYDKDGNRVYNYTASADGSANATFTAKWKHIYGMNWESDESHHWHQCDCGDKIDITEHTFEWIIDAEATETKTGVKHEECIVCNYKKEAVEIPAIGSDNPEPTDPTETVNPSQPEEEPAIPIVKGLMDTESPQTGDNSNLWLWLIVLFVSAMALTETAVFEKNEK